MMRLNKKILTITTAFVLMLTAVFSACGEADDTNYVGTLKIGYMRAGYGIEFAESWTEEYNKAHPDEQIKFIIDDTVDGGYIGSRLETSSEICDIFMVMETGWQNWARSGWIEPLDDLMKMTNDDGNVFEDVLRDGYENFGLLNGKRYVLPQSGQSAPGFAYNETLFKEHNLGEPPETLAELKALIDKINALPVNNDSDINNDIAPFAWGGLVAGYWDSAVLTWWAQKDGEAKLKEFYEMETVDVYNQRPGLESALNEFRSLICTGEGVPKNSLDGAMSKNHIRMQNDFILGKAAMMVGVYGLQNETKDLIDENTVLKMFYPPFIDGAQVDENGNPVKIMVTQGQDFLFIPSASKNKDLAKKFLLWISTNDMCRTYTRYSSFLSPYDYDMDNIEGVSALTQSIIDASKDIKMVGPILSSNPIVNQLRLHVWGGLTAPYADMVVKNLTPKQAISNAAAYANSLWDAIRKELGLNG